MHDEKNLWSRLQVTFAIIEKPVVFRLHLLYVNSTNTTSTEKTYRDRWKYPFISRSV